MLDVVGYADVTTRMRRSPTKKRSQDAKTDKHNGVDAPSEEVCRTAVWKTTKGLVMFSSI